MQIKSILNVIAGLITTVAYSQTNENLTKPNYLTFQTGLIMDGYNSMGVRTYFEYQKDFKVNWQYGISYEHSRHLASVATDHPNELSTNLSLLSLNCYYKLNLIRNRIFWTTGIGAGVVHAYWDTNDKFGGTVNASFTLNIRITKKVYFESSPLIVFIPINRVYFSNMKTVNYNGFYAFSFFPFGIKIIL